jgi:hypothetical protein
MTYGKQLQVYLMNLYPMRTDETSFVSLIDTALIADRQLIEVTYKSNINYLVRRLVVTTQWLKKRYDFDGNNTPMYHRELRNFLKNETNLPKHSIEKIFALLLECEAVSRKPLSQSMKNQIKSEAQKTGETKCYICGVELDLVSPNNYNSAEVEHLWPHQIGGSNDPDNLKLACHSCNQVKTTTIDTSDYHYEHVHIKSDETDENFSTEFSRVKELAIWSKQDFSCTTCGESAATGGKLRFVRRNRNDGWHYLNIEPYCSAHGPR